jgi:hypothetical protein
MRYEYYFHGDADLTREQKEAIVKLLWKARRQDKFDLKYWKNKSKFPIGYYRENNEIVYVSCHFKEGFKNCDKSRPILKQDAWRGDFYCAVCGLHLVTKKYRKFLDDIKKTREDKKNYK